MVKRKNVDGLEADIRRKVEKRFEERSGLLQHFLSYVIVNIMIWVIWLATAQSFPWPLFVTGGWGIGLLSHVVDYYNKHGGGARRREARIDAEVERQLERERMRADLAARDDGEFDGADVYGLDDYELRGARLSDDGELADGELIDEAEWTRDRPQRSREG